MCIASFSKTRRENGSWQGAEEFIGRRKSDDSRRAFIYGVRLSLSSLCETNKRDQSH